MSSCSCECARRLTVENEFYEFLRVQWLHFASEADKFIIFWCEISSESCVPKLFLKRLVFRRPLQVTVRPELSDSCLFCLSVTLVFCGQTVGWTEMPLGTEVGLGPGDSALDGDPAPPPTERGTAPPLFGPCLSWRNGRPSQLLPSYCSIQPQGRNVRRGDSTGHLMMMSDVVSQTNKLSAESRAFSLTRVC